MNEIKAFETSIGEVDSTYIVSVETDDPLIDPIQTVQYLCSFFQKRETHIILLKDDDFGREVAVRLAYRLDGTSLNCVERFHVDQGHCYVEKMIYSENMTAVFELQQKPFVLTCTEEKIRELLHMSTEVSAFHIGARKAHIVSWENSVPTENLSEAKQVIIGGRGAASAEGKERIENLAEMIPASIGASRAAIMDGWWKFHQLVGASGKKLHADMVLVFGVSGAAPFIAGLADCKCVVSVNTDTSAPIFKNSNYGIIADYRTIIEILTDRECD